MSIIRRLAIARQGEAPSNNAANVWQEKTKQAHSPVAAGLFLRPVTSICYFLPFSRGEPDEGYRYCLGSSRPGKTLANLAAATAASRLGLNRSRIAVPDRQPSLRLGQGLGPV